MTGEAVIVPSEALVETIKLFSETIRCVFFACHISKKIATTIADDIDCVIVPEEIPGDNAVITFSTAFYDALGSGQDVQRAHKLATLRLALTQQNGVFKLYAKKDTQNELTL